jgi:hypothetical protein
MESVDEVPVVTQEVVVDSVEPATSVEVDQVEAPKRGRSKQPKSETSDGAKKRAPRKPKNSVVVEEVPVVQEPVVEVPVVQEAPKEESVVEQPVMEVPKEEVPVEKPKRTRAKKNKVDEVVHLDGVVPDVETSSPLMNENLLNMYLLSQQAMKKQIKQEKYKRLLSGAL